MLWRSKERSKQCQSSQESLGNWAIYSMQFQCSIHLEKICKYFSHRNLLKLVAPVTFLLWGLNMIQDDSKMKFSEPWKMGFFCDMPFQNLDWQENLIIKSYCKLHCFLRLHNFNTWIYSKLNYSLFWSVSASRTATATPKSSFYRKLFLSEAMF